MLRSVIESAGLTFFPSVALVIFLAVFIGVVIRECLRPKGEAKRLANMANEEEK